jgi:hypothetical protein
MATVEPRSARFAKRRAYLLLVIQAGFEPATHGVEIRYSIGCLEKAVWRTTSK